MGLFGYELPKDDPSYVGYWGPITANVDWCEPNYLKTHYICEFWNTISNIPMIVLGLWGIIYAYQLGTRYARRTTKESSSSNEFFRFCVGFFFLFLVGIGSWMFHMTLLYKYQMLDELPMILGSIVFVHIVMDLRPPNDTVVIGEEPTKSSSIFVWIAKNPTARGVVLFLYGLATSIFMASDTSNPLPMNISYLVLMMFIIWRCYVIFQGCNTPSYAHKVVRKYFMEALVYQAIAGLCWMIEKHLCSPLYPITMYLHAVWHIFAGVGVYLFIVWTFFVAVHNHGLKPGYKPEIYKFLGLIPYVYYKRIPS
eukprot:TRINITY_DN3710_c0_g1_i1.p1 TRINITY_DN3710_c0_g1~~TRINITY_DN3710_c0_g1_i1.p1  ORF type:complete len:310 (-),score=52.00 TRINITY_DN3710_c0_g1_i1:239-1168(-)